MKTILVFLVVGIVFATGYYLGARSDDTVALKGCELVAGSLNNMLDESNYDLKVCQSGLDQCRQNVDDIFKQLMR